MISHCKFTQNCNRKTSFRIVDHHVPSCKKWQIQLEEFETKLQFMVCYAERSHWCECRQIWLLWLQFLLEQHLLSKVTSCTGTHFHQHLMSLGIKPTDSYTVCNSTTWAVLTTSRTRSPITPHQRVLCTWMLFQFRKNYKSESSRRSLHLMLSLLQYNST